MEKAFSTFDIAKICRVTPRTAANWIDQNHIKSFKTPGKYRKVLRSELLAFLQKNGMPTDGLTEIGVKRVLVIDTDAESIKAVKKIVANWGSDKVCDSSSAAFEALVKISTFRPDVLLMDAGFKGIDIFALSKLLAKPEIGSPIILVALVTKLTAKIKDEYTKEGIHRVLEKPLAPEKLEKALKS